MSLKTEMLKHPEVYDDPEGYLDALIEQAQAVILEYTKIPEWPENDSHLDVACVRYALVLYRRGGAEHATSVGVGDVNVTAFDLPQDIRFMLNARRRVAWF